MIPLDCLLAATDSLLSNPLRSALTALGIVIGVAAVVAMVAVGLGAQFRIEQAIRDIGSNMLVIGNGSRTSDGRQSGRGAHFTLTEGDAAALAREIPAVQIAAGSVGGTGRVVSGNRNWYTHLWGVTHVGAVAHHGSRAASERFSRLPAEHFFLVRFVEGDQRNSSVPIRVTALTDDAHRAHNFNACQRIEGVIW